MDILQSFQACKHAVSALKHWQNNHNPLMLSEVRLGGTPPERIATRVQINPDLLAENEADAVSPNFYLASSEDAGWAGECVVRFRATNKGNRPISIRGIGIDKELIQQEASSSVLFIPQGYSRGLPWRFVTQLNSNEPSMTLTERKRCKEEAIGPRNYFDEGSVEMDAGCTYNFSIHLRTGGGSFKCSLRLLYSIGCQQIQSLEIPTERQIFVYDLNKISESQRFRRTYSAALPWIVPERDERFSNISYSYEWY